MLCVIPIQKIEVGFAVDKDGITITVDDDGPGVSPEDREQIFRPFYRTDEARDRESGVQVWGWRLLKPPFSSIVAG